MYFSRDFHAASWAARLVFRGDATSHVEKVQDELENRLETVKARSIRRERRGEFVDGVEKLGKCLEVVKGGGGLVGEMRGLVAGLLRGGNIIEGEDCNGDLLERVGVLEKMKEVLGMMIEAVGLFENIQGFIGDAESLGKVVRCEELLSGWPLCEMECLREMRGKVGVMMERVLRGLEELAERAVWSGEKGREGCILTLERISDKGTVAKAVMKEPDVKFKNIVRDCVIRQMDQRSVGKRKFSHNTAAVSDPFAQATKAFPSVICPEESRTVAARLVTEVGDRFMKVLTNFIELINIDPILSECSVTREAVVHMWTQIQESIQGLCSALCGLNQDEEGHIETFETQNQDPRANNFSRNTKSSFSFLPPLLNLQNEKVFSDGKVERPLSLQPQSMWQVVPSTKFDLQINALEETLDWREFIDEEESISGILAALPVIKPSIYNYHKIMPSLKRLLSRGCSLIASHTHPLEISNQLAGFMILCHEKLKVTRKNDMQTFAAMIRIPPPIAMLPPASPKKSNQPLQHLPQTDTVLRALQEYSDVLRRSEVSGDKEEMNESISASQNLYSSKQEGNIEMITAFAEQCLKTIELVAQWTAFSKVMDICPVGCEGVQGTEVVSRLTQECMSRKRLSRNEIKAITRVAVSLNLVRERTTFATEIVQNARRKALTLLRAEVVGTIWIHITRAYDLVKSEIVLDEEHDETCSDSEPKSEMTESKSSQNQTDEYGDILVLSLRNIDNSEAKMQDEKISMVRAGGMDFGEEMAELQKIWRFSLNLQSRDEAFGDLEELVKLIVVTEGRRRNVSESTLEPWMSGWYSTGEWHHIKGKTAVNSNHR